MSMSPCLVQCEIRPGLAPCSRTAVGPGSFHAAEEAADVHVPPVERLLGGLLVLAVGIGVPDLDGRVDVEHSPLAAPLEQLAAVDVPGQVDQQVARRKVLAQQRAEIVGPHAVADEGDSLLDPGRKRLGLVLEVHHRDVLRRDLHVLEEDRQRALRDRPKTQEEDFVLKRRHRCCVLQGQVRARFRREGAAASRQRIVSTLHPEPIILLGNRGAVKGLGARPRASLANGHAQAVR